MGISADTKDWTWVLERPCPECGFSAADVDFAHIPRLVRENAARWQPVLQRMDVASRPDEQTWSALEYAAHVRDVFRIFDERLTLMLAEDDPAFPNWDQDATAVLERYNEQEPAVVARELAEAAASVAASFAAVGPAGQGRTGRRSDGARFTVTTMGQYFVHDPVHHLHDVAGD
ncbi:DinB family protein [Cryobacterium sp. TMT2-15-1]|uniref:DinB family protein n=1 Tax=Cryobacterium sp. TMT2-15-1 TaxID=1259246 RepID=UPI00106BC49B|nr:DinB family protein [Cryobacterium sp. TMT2-15-1]TFC56736.1 DinB family protein [Cryobacterium sp. TMT2-15-1]